MHIHRLLPSKDCKFVQNENKSGDFQLILSCGTNTCVDNMHILFNLLFLGSSHCHCDVLGEKSKGENEENIMQEKNVKG